MSGFSQCLDSVHVPQRSHDEQDATRLKQNKKQKKRNISGWTWRLHIFNRQHVLQTGCMGFERHGHLPEREGPMKNKMHYGNYRSVFGPILGTISQDISASDHSFYNLFITLRYIICHMPLKEYKYNSFEKNYCTILRPPRIQLHFNMISQIHEILLLRNGLMWAAVMLTNTSTPFSATVSHSNSSTAAVF